MLRGNKKNLVREVSNKKVVIPYIHGVSHRIKKGARKFNIEVLFSFPMKNSSLSAIFGKKVDENNSRGRGLCNNKQHEELLRCQQKVIYQPKLGCGKFYIGQSGLCVLLYRVEKHLKH